jgi:hypothetical protein
VCADPRPLLVDEPALSARKDKERKKVLTGGIWALRRVELGIGQTKLRRGAARSRHTKGENERQTQGLSLMKMTGRA